MEEKEMIYIVRLASIEHGREDFHYTILKEARKGFRILAASCSGAYKQDGVLRTLTLLRNNNKITKVMSSQHIGNA
jgi:hypothetical protein